MKCGESEGNLLLTSSLFSMLAHTERGEMMNMILVRFYFSRCVTRCFYCESCEILRGKHTVFDGRGLGCYVSSIIDVRRGCEVGTSTEAYERSWTILLHIASLNSSGSATKCIETDSSRRLLRCV